MTLSQADSRIIQSNPDAGYKLGGKADKPGVGVVIGRARLSGGGTVKSVFPSRRATRPISYNAFQHIRHDIGCFFGESHPTLEGAFIKHVTVAVRDAHNAEGFAIYTAIGENSIGGRQLDGNNAAGTQRNRVNCIESRGDAQLPGVADDVFRLNDLLDEPDCHQVQRLLQSNSQRGQTAAAAVIIGRRPARAVRHVDDDVLIQQPERRWITVVDRCCI